MTPVPPSVSRLTPVAQALQQAALPNFSAEVHAALKLPQSKLVPGSVRDLLQRMADQIDTTARDLQDLRQQLAASESTPR